MSFTNKPISRRNFVRISAVAAVSAQVYPVLAHSGKSNSRSRIIRIHDPEATKPWDYTANAPWDHTVEPGETGNPEKIKGILHTKDLLRYSRNERITLHELVRPVSFVPETKPIRDLLGDLISSHRQVVIVVDEHGSYEGIVTLEDILEEIFGEIRDRREPRVEEYNLIDEDHIVVEGSMHLEDLNDVFGTRLESKDVETINGFLCDLVGRIPGEGESFISGGLRFLVLSTGKTKVEKMKIERLGEEDEE